MTKNLKASTAKTPKPRGRNGGRKRLPPEEKAVQSNIYLPGALNDDLQKLVPLASDRNKLVTRWVRAYLISNGESDRLLAQSPTVAKVLSYLEETEAPQELRDEVESLIVNRDMGELKIERNYYVV